MIKTKRTLYYPGTKNGTLSKNRERTLGIYLAKRGDEFKNFIQTLLKSDGIKDRYIKMLTDEEGMKKYAAAFTSEQVSTDNYQVMEQIGDLLANKFIVKYMYNRFPQLKCAEGVKVVARLRINYGSTKSFANIAKKLGFEKWISATNDLRERKMSSLLEDVFEAFLGTTECILDEIRNGVGYAIVYDFLKSIFDEMPISLHYTDLYDNKTQLKELFDRNKEMLDEFKFREIRGEGSTISKIYKISQGRSELIATGEGGNKQDAQQDASAKALKFLEGRGVCKYIPPIYRKFMGHKETVDHITPDRIKKQWSSDGKFHINEMYKTRNKTKYQTNYQSTVIAMYCFKRMIEGVVACMELGANMNIPDSEGVYPLDNLLVGTIEKDMVNDICKLFRNTKELIMVSTNTIDRYGRYYDLTNLNLKSV